VTDQQPNRVEMTEAELKIVRTLSLGLVNAKAQRSDAQKALADAERSVEIADARAAAGIASIVALRELAGDWNVEGGFLVRRG
jgi:hypothetical protein